MIVSFLLSYPNTPYVVEGIRGPIAFTIAPSRGERVIVLCLLGVMMAFGMAAVFKHIPSYYPDHVGAVGGVVGMIGGLGGFFLPIAFGVMNDLVGIWSSRSEEHTSELQSLMRSTYAVFCLKKKKYDNN